MGCADDGRQDAGVDAGPCGAPSRFGDAGSRLSLVATYCPRDASIYVRNEFMVTVLGADGGVAAMIPGCSSCDRCAGIETCDSFGALSEIPPGTTRLFVTFTDGKVAGALSTCPGSTNQCRLMEAAAPGTYWAHFCISRSDAGEPPLECVDVPFKVPFEVGGVGAGFE